MAAPMRIGRPSVRSGTLAAGAAGADEFKYYLDRLMKLIPAEVISLYLVGQGVIPAGSVAFTIVWAVICLVGVVVVRAYGTQDPQANLPTDWAHVGISSASFLIWVYTLGGPFELAGIHVPFVGSLLVLAWTFFVPYFYKGPG